MFAAALTKPAKPSQLFNELTRVFADRHREHSAAPVAAAPAPEARPERILLAEDNVVNQKVALHMLARLNYRADLASNGLEVLEALERQRYDIVLMDVQMPEMDGLEAARRLRSQRREAGARGPWIIALTANAQQEDRDRCLAAGMDDYISKPLKVTDLAAALERARQARKT